MSPSSNRRIPGVEWTSSDRDSLELLVRLAEFGELVTDAVRQTTGGMDLSDNLSVVILCRLELDGPLRPTDIIEFTGLTSGGVTKVVSRLEDSGLVTRRYGAFAEDRRGVAISLTPKGEALIRSFAGELGIRISEAGPLIKDMNRLLE